MGLSTAIALKEKKPSSSVLVLEAGLFPSGASTKNAGFACFGSLTELLSDYREMGENEMLSLVKKRWEGLRILRQRLGDEDIDYRGFGGYELIFDGNTEDLHHIDEVNSWLHPLFGDKVFQLKDDRIQEFGFNTSKVRHLIHNKFEGQVNTGEMMKKLQSYARKLNIETITGAIVKKVNKENNGARVSLSFGNQSLDLKAQKVGICTNAFTKTLLPDIDLKPGRGQVIVTKPIKGLPFKGVFHFEEGYFYFRNFGNRVILGGGRNLFAEEETTTEIQNTKAVTDLLEKKLSEIIIPGEDYEIDHSWAGIMAFGKVKKPVLEKINDSVFMGVRLGGMGVAIGSGIGHDLAEMMCEE